MYAVKFQHCNWFEKETDLPIADQNAVRWERQIENAGRIRVELGVTRKMQRENKMNLPC